VALLPLARSGEERPCVHGVWEELFGIMEKRQLGIIWVVAIGQFIPLMLYPPGSLAAASPIFLILPLVFFAFLGYNLVMRKRWAKTLTIFMQGFNIIVRIMLVLSHGAYSLKTGGGYNWPVIVTGMVSILLSTLILYRFDVPEVELAFE